MNILQNTTCTLKVDENLKNSNFLFPPFEYLINKNINIVGDHSMNIPIKFGRFGEEV